MCMKKNTYTHILRCYVDFKTGHIEGEGIKRERRI